MNRIDSILYLLLSDMIFFLFRTEAYFWTGYSLNFSNFTHGKYDSPTALMFKRGKYSNMSVAFYVLTSEVGMILDYLS